MAWEQRGGHSYYYAKKRVGARVSSQYCGRGQDAELICEMVEKDPVAKITNEHIERSSKEYQEEFVRRLDENEDMIMSLVTACLTFAGYRNHKGEWRKKRHEA